MSRDIIIISRRGQVARFSPMTVRKLPRGASGVAGMKLREGDSVAAVTTAGEGDSLTICTAHGVVLRMDADSIPRKGRATMGVTGIKFKFDSDYVVGVSVTEGEASA